MGLFKRQKKMTNTRSGQMIGFVNAEDLTVSGYTSLAHNPEIIAGCRQIAQLISSMTIYLMANTSRGDIRVVNELSRAVDINPNTAMTRRTWMDAIVMNLLLYGNGNSIVWPHTQDGYLRDLEVIEPSRVSFKQSNNQAGYEIFIDGVSHNPVDILHFVHNPDSLKPWKGCGLRVALRDVANNLKQASATERGFMESKWKPSVIVKVDAMVDEFSSPEGRKKLLDDYVKTSEAGEPWLIPAEQFSVDQVRPLTLGDLAIADVVTLDKRTVASILGVPPFVLGVGDYNPSAWDAFINTTIRVIAQEIEQELTKKLLLSPKMYWMFNISKLYSYDIKAVADVYGGLYDKGVVTGNEVREKLSMEPKEGLDELLVLENYIPVEKSGQQKKLKGEDDG